MYNTETINVQFLNQSFLDKIDQGMTKEASVAMSAFVRQKLREDGFARKILMPTLVTAADLDRQITEEPTVIIEKEPDSIAASVPFVGRPEIRYFKGARYPVTFNKIESAEFKKSKFELATYRTDIRTVLQENSVKDLQKQEDQSLYNAVTTIAAANSNVYTISGGFTVQTLMNGVKNLLAKQVPVGTLLMTQEMYADLIKQPATQVGSGVAGSLMTGTANLDNFYGWKIITTNKNDILPNNQCIAFAPPQYLGQFLMLQDSMVYLETRADMISFKTYEAVGMGFGNVNGAVVLNF
ncbi:MAG: hypothetical protein JHC33_15585 [Ignisphaera sp.]|nr:hypothetical protein [Ignisphaera sp.]